jgi:hypothetical protein
LVASLSRIDQLHKYDACQRTKHTYYVYAYLSLLGTWLRYGNLDVDNEGFPQQYLLAKNESVPSVQGGVLWSDTSNKVMYLYGGEYGNDKPEDFTLWYYDIIYDTWNRSDVRTADIRRASWGMFLFYMCIAEC